MPGNESLDRTPPQGSARTLPDAAGSEARRLRNHRVEILEAATSVLLVTALREFFKPGLNLDGSERTDQREMLYDPIVGRQGAALSWYAVIFFTE